MRGSAAHDFGWPETAAGIGLNYCTGGKRDDAYAGEPVAGPFRRGVAHDLRNEDEGPWAYDCCGKHGGTGRMMRSMWRLK